MLIVQSEFLYPGTPRVYRHEPSAYPILFFCVSYPEMYVSVDSERREWGMVQMLPECPYD